jgi:hypothetical protein
MFRYVPAISFHEHYLPISRILVTTMCYQPGTYVRYYPDIFALGTPGQEFSDSISPVPV